MRVPHGMIEISPDTLRMAIILGVVLPGVGHMYLGQIKRGIKIVILLVFSGTVSAVLFSYVSTTIGMLSAGGTQFLPILSGLVAPAISLIPLIVWVWQIRDLRRIIKLLTGRSIEEIDPPYLQLGANNPKESRVCSACGRYTSKESQICDNCGFAS